jgi:Transglutaminase-like superfamily
VFRAWSQLLTYDMTYWRRGFAGVTAQLATEETARRQATEHLEGAVPAAVALAMCFYWKRVLCLQRSVCAVRLLRRRGVPAQLVIGYRPVPFLSHAWVEVDGRVINDSPAYKARLRVLLIT